MSSTRLTRANKYKLKQFLVKFCVFLLVIGGVLPFASPAQIYANAEGAGVEETPPVKVNQVQANNSITINDTDQYTITRINGKWHIVQYDGNNISAGPIAMVELDKQTINNALAVDKNKDVLYAPDYSSHDLMKIYPDGTTEVVTKIEDYGHSAGALSPDGTKYVHDYLLNDQRYIEFVDLVTFEKTSVRINDQTGFNGGGDLAFDADGSLWFSRWSADPIMGVIAKIDQETGDILSAIPMVTDTGRSFSHAGALSFLPNGKMLVYGQQLVPSDYTPYLLEFDLATGIATVIAQDVGDTYDFASSVYPSIKPNLQIEKTNDPSGTVAPGGNITYTLKVTNTGNLASTLTKIQDELPEGTSYVPGTTTLNGEKVADVDGTSPIFTGMSVQSPGESLAGVLYTGEENAEL
ncbi:conserved repeat domain [Chlamydia abortus]|nr:conserved repeat domain [Chlamydia abortus]